MYGLVIILGLFMIAYGIMIIVSPRRLLHGMYVVGIRKEKDYPDSLVPKMVISGVISLIIGIYLVVTLFF